jgi:DNA invertase Pin-like site-specific DNA recombinase
MRRYIAYYRVSTKEQGDSGLGLESQKQIVERFIESEKKRTTSLDFPNGRPMCLLAEYTDIESGKSTERQGLNNAIEHCRAIMNKISSESKSFGRNGDVVLIIAKLDRLSRNLSFISTLMESNVKFVCCDMPTADNTTIHIFGALAQREAEMISIRTKNALTIKKQQIEQNGGFTDCYGEWRTGLGNPQNLTDEARKKGAQKNKELSLNNPDNLRLYSFANMLRNEIKGNGKSGGLTFAKIADRMNKNGFRTSEGSLLTGGIIFRLLKNFQVTEE